MADIQTAEKEYSTRLSKVAQKNQQTQVLGNLLEIKQAELRQHENEYSILRAERENLYSERQYLEDLMKQTEKARELLNEKKIKEDFITRKKEAKSKKLLEMKDLTKYAWQGMVSQRIRTALLQLEDEIKILEDKKTKRFIAEQLIDQIKVAFDAGKCPVCEQHILNEIRDALKVKTEFKVGFEGLSIDEQSKLVNLQGRRSRLLKLNVEELKTQIAALEKGLDEITVDISDAEQRIRDINKNIVEVGGLENASTVSNDYTKCIQKFITQTKA